MLATVQLRRNQLPGAIARFAELADRHDLREAWLGLAAAHHRAGDHTEAATALHALLSAHVQEVNPSLIALADAISRASGAPGWCCIGTDHRIVVMPAGLPVRFALDGRDRSSPPRQLPRAGELDVVSPAGTLLGAPLQLRRLFRLDGFVGTTPSGGLSGWAWHPNDPATAPSLTLIFADGTHRHLPTGPPDTDSARDAGQHDRPLFQVHPFALSPSDLPAEEVVRVVGSDGRDLPGSPVDPHALARYAAAVTQAVAGVMDRAPAAILQAPVPAAYRGVHRPARRGRAALISIVVPVYRGYAATLACLDSLFAATMPARIIVIDDDGPEAALAAALDRLAAAGRITLIRHARNHGFPAAANTGIRAAGRDDVVLLNADTLVPRTWLAGLRDAAYAAPDIGTATPFSNDATLLSYPGPVGSNAMPDLAATERLHRLAGRANAGVTIEIPTAVGFCMYLRRDCLDQVGLLRQDVFAQGYAEENDFCMRARHLGWRHVAAPSVFVGHIGGQSFGAARTPLLIRNLATLNRLHPGYDALIAGNDSGPALAAARRRLDLAVLKTRRSRTMQRAAVILITHDTGGGVQRQVDVRCAAIRAVGHIPIVLRPELARPLLQGTGACVVDLAPDLPNLIFHVATELPALVRLLAAQNPCRVELHHLLGHDQALAGLAARLGVPCEVHIHDYNWFCPRISLVGFERRYCGEPDLAGCEACIADAGRATDDETPVPALVARSARTLAAAARVIAPSADAAARINRHFPTIRAEVHPWDDSRPPEPVRVGQSASRTVGVLGAIGIEKGYDVLLACARDAAGRALDLRFVVIGHTTDDARLLDTGRVFVTGEYAPADLQGLIAAESVDLAFLPSIWPETWCFTLSEAWRAGLGAVAFDIGAPAERIRRHGGGAVLPLGLRAPQINDALLRLGRD